MAEWREKNPQPPKLSREPDVGLIPGPWDHDLSQRQTLNQLSHPGVPDGVFSQLSESWP